MVTKSKKKRSRSASRKRSKSPTPARKKQKRSSRSRTPSKRKATTQKKKKKQPTIDLDSMGQKELKTMCSEAGLPVYGTTGALRARLAPHIDSCGGSLEAATGCDLAEARRLVKVLGTNEVRQMLVAAMRMHKSVYNRIKEKVEPSPNSGSVPTKFVPETWRKKGSQTIKGPNKNSGRWRKGRQMVNRAIAEALRYDFKGEPETAFRAIVAILEGFSWDSRLPRHHYHNWEVWCWCSDDCKEMWELIVTSMTQLMNKAPALVSDKQLWSRLEHVENFCSNYGAMDLAEIVELFDLSFSDDEDAMEDEKSC